MKTVWYDYEKIDKDCKTAIAIGNFDGLHKGHAKIMELLKKVSSENNLASLCYTFSVHPINEIKGEGSLPLIEDNAQKEKLLQKTGIDYLFFEDFKKVRELPAHDFVRDVLVSRLNMKVAVVGPHNHYGKNGEGDIRLLRELGQKYGFLVYMADPFFLDDVMCSSTKIREYIKEGRMEEASDMLGRNFSVSGTVVKDKGLGRNLGFPTANIIPKSNMIMPQPGVYATSVLIDGTLYKSITNVGTCPTVNDNKTKLETHILDYSGDLYGKELEVMFKSKIRETINFENVDSLKKQLSEDVGKRKKMD